MIQDLSPLPNDSLVCLFYHFLINQRLVIYRNIVFCALFKALCICVSFLYDKREPSLIVLAIIQSKVGWNGYPCDLLHQPLEYYRVLTLTPRIFALELIKKKLIIENEHFINSRKSWEIKFLWMVGPFINKRKIIYLWWRVCWNKWG